MVRKAINVLSPIAALAVLWVSVQAFMPSSEEGPAETAQSSAQPTVPTTIASPVEVPEGSVLPDLVSVSRVVEATTPGLADAQDNTIPESIRRVLEGSGAVLLLPTEEGQ
jgi:hypothetical protein